MAMMKNDQINEKKQRQEPLPEEVETILNDEDLDAVAGGTTLPQYVNDGGYR